MSRTGLATLGLAVILLTGCSTIKSWMPGSDSSSSSSASTASAPMQQPVPCQIVTSTAGGGRAAPAYCIVDTSLGKVLATNRGMTLYTSAGDTVPGMSMCNDACAGNWPPLIALDDATPSGKWSVIQRVDGLKQWTYDGRPLYGWREDKRQGDIMGDGRLNGAWRAARP